MSLLGPTAIAIHDDGNVLGQCGCGLYGHELNKKTTSTLPPFAE
jgi:hypothetical protein